MPRIKIDLPDRFPFATEIAIYRSHINVGGHLDNAQLLTLVSEARARYLAFLGFTEGDVEGYTITIADSALQYLSEGFYGDLLLVEMAYGDPNKYGGDLIWRACTKAEGREVARGKMGFVFLDLDSRKVVAVPPAFLAKVRATQQEDQ